MRHKVKFKNKIMKNLILLLILATALMVQIFICNYQLITAILWIFVGINGIFNMYEKK
jgi:hypothetical protein